MTNWDNAGEVEERIHEYLKNTTGGWRLNEWRGLSKEERKQLLIRREECRAKMEEVWAQIQGLLKENDMYLHCSREGGAFGLSVEFSRSNGYVNDTIWSDDE